VDLIIVRRGDTERFRFLQETYRSRPSVHVMWDRRLGDRRREEQSVPVERRRTDRRSAPPSTWEKMGFIYVEERERRAASK